MLSRLGVLPLLAALLLVGGCQQADLPPWMGGTKPSAPPVVAPATIPEPPPTPEATIPPPPSVQVAPLAPPPETGKPQKIAVPGNAVAALLLPLSGPYAGLGLAMSNAAQLALFETADTNFQLVPFDTGGTADGALQAMRLALAQGANIVLGPLFAQEVVAAAPLAREQNVPVLAFTTNRQATGSGVYALGILPGPQVARVVSYARSLGRERFALLAPDNDMGRAVAEALSKAVLDNNVRLVKTAFYPPETKDLMPLVKRFTEFDARTHALTSLRARLALRTDDAAKAELKRLEPALTLGEPPFDAVLIPDEGVRLKGVAALVTYFDIDPSRVSLLGTLLWDDAKLGSEPALVGGLFAAPPTATHQDFERRYALAFGPLAPRAGTLASIAYDAVSLAAILARQGQSDYSEAALTDAKGFEGIDGLFRLLPDGTSERGLDVREITRAGSQVISPAPAAFKQ